MNKDTKLGKAANLALLIFLILGMSSIATATTFDVMKAGIDDGDDTRRINTQGSDENPNYDGRCAIRTREADSINSNDNVIFYQSPGAKIAEDPSLELDEIVKFSGTLSEGENWYNLFSSDGFNAFPVEKQPGDDAPYFLKDDEDSTEVTNEVLCHSPPEEPEGEWMVCNEDVEGRVMLENLEGRPGFSESELQGVTRAGDEAYRCNDASWEKITGRGIQTEILNADNSVMEGQEVDVEFRITSERFQKEDINIGLIVDGEVVTEREIEDMEAGGQQTVTLSWEAPDDDIPENTRTVEIEVGADHQEGRPSREVEIVSVGDAPFYLVDDITSSPDNVEIGETASITAKIENFGAADAEDKVVSADSSGFESSEKSLSIEGLETVTKTFELEATTLGTHDVRIISEDEEESENNNGEVVEIEVVEDAQGAEEGSETQAPDLSIEEVNNYPDDVDSGTLPVNVTVNNNGGPANFRIRGALRSRKNTYDSPNTDITHYITHNCWAFGTGIEEDGQKTVTLAYDIGSAYDSLGGYSSELELELYASNGPDDYYFTSLEDRFNSENEENQNQVTLAEQPSGENNAENSFECENPYMTAGEDVDRTHPPDEPNTAEEIWEDNFGSPEEYNYQDAEQSEEDTSNQDNDNWRENIETGDDRSQTDEPLAEIENWEELHNTRNNPNGRYKLVNNLGENTEGYEEYVADGWKPIKNFNGILDGKNNEIQDLKVNTSGDPDSGHAGLFNNVIVRDTDTIIRNLKISDAEISGGYSSGAVAGRAINSDPIKVLSIRADVEKSVIEGEEAGGIVGTMGAPAGRDAILNGDVKHSRITGYESGGLAGHFYGYTEWGQTKIDYPDTENNTVVGIEPFQGPTHVGSIVGLLDAQIKNAESDSRDSIIVRKHNESNQEYTCEDRSVSEFMVGTLKASEVDLESRDLSCIEYTPELPSASLNIRDIEIERDGNATILLNTNIQDTGDYRLVATLNGEEVLREEISRESPSSSRIKQWQIDAEEGDEYSIEIIAPGTLWNPLDNDQVQGSAEGTIEPQTMHFDKTDEELVSEYLDVFEEYDSEIDGKGVIGVVDVGNAWNSYDNNEIEEHEYRAFEEALNRGLNYSKVAEELEEESTGDNNGETQEEESGLQAGLELSSNTISAGGALTIDATVSENLAERGYEIQVKGPEEKSWSFQNQEISQETTIETPGTYSTVLKPQEGTLNKLANLLPGSSTDQVVKVFRVEGSGEDDSGEAEDEVDIDRWKEYCNSNEYDPEDPEERFQCIEQDISSEYFESPAPENPDYEIPESICQYFLDTGYSQEEMRCNVDG